MQADPSGILSRVAASMKSTALRALITFAAGRAVTAGGSLNDLGAEAAGELALPAEGVLSRDASLLVGGGAEGQVGLAEQPVVGDDAVAGGEHTGHAGVRLPVDGDGLPDAERRAGAGGQAGVGPDADDDRDQVRRAGDGLTAAGGGLDVTVVPVRTSTP